ncbi:MAG: ATP-binding protein [Actinomycetota bacterium]|nr:ATP-binding protein [Actinomycetota bacterium]
MSKYEDGCGALAIALSAGMPVLLWGGPGVGKTSVIEQIARTRGWHLETVIASICDPTDFKGMPRDAGDRTVFSPPEWAVRVAEAGGGVVFLDEISTAPPSVQAALLRPVLTGVVGDLELPPGTRFVAAANPPDQAADGWDLSAPLANRFVHIDWEVPARVVTDGFVYGFAPVAVPEVDESDVERLLAEARRAIGAFIAARPDLVHRLPTASSARGRAWPSPRSWDMAARLLATAEAAATRQGIKQLLVAGAVGPSTAREYFAWHRSLDLPDIEAALDAGGSIDLPATPDRIVAVCGALAAAVNADPTAARCDAAVNGILVAVANAGHLDLATVALRKIAPAVRQSGAVLGPAAVGHFATLLGKMGALKATA